MRFKTSTDKDKSSDFRGFALNYTLIPCQESKNPDSIEVLKNLKENSCEKRFNSRNFMLASDLTVNGTYPDNSGKFLELFFCE